MGSKESQYGEWIELYNDADEEVDLSGAALFEDSGNTLVINLSKKIAGLSYFLIERVTTSSPDPVSGVNDVSGSFGGGGLSNSGEHLVLKDRSGQILDSVSALSAWPAGDKDSKETMQRNLSQTGGPVWITATATPRAQNVSTAIVPVSPVSSAYIEGPSTHASPSTHAGPSTLSFQKNERDFRVSAGRDRMVTLGNELIFEATADEVDTPRSEIKYVWSFGDGGKAEGKKVSRSYYFPGEYAVVLNAKDGERQAISRLKVKVVPLEVKVSVRENNLSFENKSAYELNVGGWKAENGDQSYVFPTDTIVFPRNRIIFPATITKLLMKPENNFALLYPSGELATKLEHKEDKLTAFQKIIADLRQKLMEIRRQLEDLSD